MQVAEQTQSQQPEQSAPEGDGSLDAAAAALAARMEPEQGAQQNEPETEGTAADEETDTEAEQADPDADAEPAETVEVEIDGVKLQLPAEQAAKVQKAALRQSDYSRKMNEVSDKGKEYERLTADAQRLAEGAEKFAEVLAETRVIDAQIKQYEAVNWQELRRDNPAEFAAMAAELQALRLSKQDAQSKAQAVSRELEEAKGKGLHEKRAAMLKTLEKDLPGWGDELGQQITQYAVAKGWTVESLTQLTDPQVVIALDKARKFDNIE
ncbi:MAG: hypothetical protein ACRCYS_11785 [Beijerinckiaceae bacterium]